MLLRRQAFTLIELLVVIAIISILASILLPVFASAREKARQSTCLNNAHQIAAAIPMYNSDFDERMPPLLLNLKVAPGKLTWIGQLQPYLKTYEVMRCPDMPDALSPTTGVSIWVNPPDLRNIGIWEAYAWNGDYMDQALGDCSNFNVPATPQAGPPTLLSAIANASQTVMFVGGALEPGAGAVQGSSSLYPLHGGYYWGSSPAVQTAPDACGFPNFGWGRGSFLGPYGGFEQPRHQDLGGTVAFVDGHVKFMTAGQLAAGTNWNLNVSNKNIVVTDRTQYLWDLQ